MQTPAATNSPQAEAGAHEPRGAMPNASLAGPADSTHEIFQGVPQASPAGFPIDPEGPADAEWRIRLESLFDERQSRLREVNQAESVMDETRSKVVQTEQAINAAKMELAALPGRFLSLEVDKKREMRRGSLVGVQQINGQQNLLRQQETRLLQLIPGLEKQLVELQRQLPSLQKTCGTKQREWEAFCSRWTDFQDPFGRRPDADQRQMVELCTAWLTEDSRFCEAYNLRGFARLQLGQREAAMADFTAIIEAAQQGQLCPFQQEQLVRAFAGRASAQAALGREAEAMRDFTQAGTLAPKSALVRICHGIAEARFEHYRSALNDFQMAIKLDPQEPAAYREAAWLLATSPVRNGSRAVELGRQACELTDEKDWRCLDTLAVACASAGDFRSAKEHVAKALALAPPSVRSGIERHLNMFEESVPPHNLPQP